jgi:methylamine methyltransferase corrinoid protein reductive activase
MAKIGIALDLGTSGFRGQALNLDQDGLIISTAVTTRHPLPGANVMDHLHFAIEMGLKRSSTIIVLAINKVIDNLGINIDEVVRLAVCGNPIQLSLFQEMEIRDLAYAGKNKLEALGVVAPSRDARIIKACEISGLNLPDDADILIPPAVRHEIGADALAMMIQTGMLEKDEIAIATDYGTNAEMAIIVNGKVYTGSTAAGPALEGQHIEDGMLALPGAISDVEFEADNAKDSDASDTSSQNHPLSGRLKSFVLNEKMRVMPGDTVDPLTGDLLEKGVEKAMGITGTGVLALISQGLAAKIIQLPKISTPDARIHLPNKINFTEKDLEEAGKAIGAIRAGHITLSKEAGVNLEDIETAYMAGASGTYVDALKAQEIGLVPKGINKIYQVGNSSLAMATDLVKNVDELWRMKQIADDLKQRHCMFADSKVFEKLFILELAYWSQGMSLADYHKYMKKFGLSSLKEGSAITEVTKTVKQDIPELGIRGLKVIYEIGAQKSCSFENCIGCSSCVEECPENALFIETGDELFPITMDLARCNGLACRRCEKVCPEKVFVQKDFYHIDDE